MKFSALVASAVAATSAVAAPQPKPPMSCEPLECIHPLRTYRYWVKSGDIIQDPQDQLLVVKDGVAEHETTTIVIFEPDAANEGKTCKFVFDLWDRDVSTGSQKADVFSVIDPPKPFANARTVAELRPAQSRDQHRGRLSVPQPGTADWIMSFGGWKDGFPCPYEEPMAVEIVGAGDELAIRWDIGATGPRMKVI